MAALHPALQKNVRNKNVKSQGFLGFNRKVSEEQLAAFTKSLAILIAAKINLPDAILQVSQQSKSKVLVRCGQAIFLGLRNGKSLSKCLGVFPHIFSNAYVALVNSGETAGILEIVLQRLAKHLKRNADLKRKVKMALIYPAVVLGIAFSALGFLLVAVVPTFKDMFRDFNAELPGITKMVLGLSDIVQDYWWIFLLGFLLTFLAIRQFAKTDIGKGFLERFLLKLPWVGEIWRKSVVTQFCQTMGTLLENGVDILLAVQIAAPATKSIGLQHEMQQVQQSLGKGKPLTYALQHSTYFDASALQLLAVGEKTTTLDQMLGFIHEQYDEEVSEGIEALTGLIEPLLIVILGLLVGTILVAMYLPMFEMVNVVER